MRKMYDDYAIALQDLFMLTMLQGLPFSRFIHIAAALISQYRVGNGGSAIDPSIADAKDGVVVEDACPIGS